MTKHIRINRCCWCPFANEVENSNGWCDQGGFSISWQDSVVPDRCPLRKQSITVEFGPTNILSSQIRED